MKKTDNITWLIDNRKFLNISAIEAEIGMPESTLKHFLNDIRPLPEKWREPLLKWIEELKSKVY